jgi:hypothetical protein
VDDIGGYLRWGKSTNMGFKSNLFVYCHAGDPSQDLMHARQGLYH